MQKRLLLLFITVIGITSAKAQDIWITRNGNVVFHAGTSLEDIDGTNSEVASLFNIKTGDLAFQVPIKSFHFKRALMEDHFNENYMESNITKDGTYPVTVEGDLMIHGFTKKVNVPGTITITGGKINAAANFKVLISDYNIPIPGVVSEKIAKEAVIELKCNYEKKN